MSLAGCSSEDDDLQNFITETSNKEAGGRVEEDRCPEVKPQQTAAYADMDQQRSPFTPTFAQRQESRTCVPMRIAIASSSSSTRWTR